MDDKEIKAAITVLLTTDGKGKSEKKDAIEKLLLDTAQHGPVATLAILRTYF